ncbi:regulator of G-protein signaling 12 isoform X3 [Patella vulgata]|nr:regulator of G-protein signaling 12 isoform X3 [Patella vulgata]
MHPQQQMRRRKKRPMHGVKTVQVSRGKSGYGFTISGQHPCVLSCIVNGSPAEQMGLKPGDYVMSVNGENVSRSSHDSVVRMVGLSTGTLELQVAENLNDSDSSEEDYHPRLKSRFPNRVRPRQPKNLPPKAPDSHRSHNSKLETKGTNCRLNVQGTEGGAYGKENSHNGSSNGARLKTSYSSQSLKSVSSASTMQNSLSNSHAHHVSQNSLSYVSYHSLNSQHSYASNSSHSNLVHNSHSNLTQSSRSNSSHHSHSQPNLNLHGDRSGHTRNRYYEDMNSVALAYNIPAGHLPSDSINSDNSENSGVFNEYGDVRAVVGYIGSIEMPSDANRPHQRLQSLRNAVRRLRIEKKIHTLVLMDVHSDGVGLTNTGGKIIAQYPADKLAFSGVCPDDKRFFGIVTLHDHSDDVSEFSGRHENVGTASSCHIFMVDPELRSHSMHAQKAKSFSIQCTVDHDTLSCLEFPRSSTHIILAVANLYKDRQGDGYENEIIRSQAFANPARPAQRSSSNSSNSDSGLGFGKDDNANERGFIVDMAVEEPVQPRPSAIGARGSNPAIHHLSPEVQTIPSSRSNFKRPGSAFELRRQMNNSTSSEECWQGNSSSNKLNPRAMPNPHRSWRNDNPQHHHNSAENLRQSMRNLLQQRKGPNEVSSDDSCKNEFVKGQFISPRPRSAPFTQLNSINDRVETVDLNMARLSPRSYCRNKAMLRSPSAPPIPYFHPDDFDDSDSDSDEDSMVRKVIQRFNHDKTLLHEQDQRRFSESFAVATKREKERSDNNHVQRWRKTASFRRNKALKYPSHSHESLIVGDGDTTHKLLPANSVNSIVQHVNKIDEDDDSGRIAGWAVNFEKLLQDEAGLAVFTEFLKKEFSEENIIFWTACKDYKNITDEQERNIKAKEIYNRHLSTRATDPVNVDSAARLHADKFIDTPNAIMFDLAQQQIFRLMKTDSYARFLKSELYKTYLLREIEGQPLDLPVIESEVEKKPAGDKKKKGKENEEKTRRRSLLPWKQSKSKNPKSASDSELKRLGKVKGSKEDISKPIKERKEEHTKKLPGPGIDLSTMRKEVFSSKEPVAEKKAEQNEGQFKFCRVIMPDGSTTVVCAKPGQTTRSVLGKLCEKRSLSIASVDVFLLGCDKPLDLSEDISLLGSKEVIIERRVLFRMDLPNKKSIGVKAKPNRTIRDVFKPILNKYGYRVDQVGVQLSGGSDFLDLEVLVSEVDNQRIIIISKEDLNGYYGNIICYCQKEWGGNDQRVMLTAKPPLASAKFKTKASVHTSASLEEITNGIFEDLMKGKSENIHKFDDLGVLEFDNGKLFRNPEGNRSSNLLGLLRKESWGKERNKPKVRNKVTFAHPKIENSKKTSDQEDEKLFELLRKAQSHRLDDQRGLTTSSVEMPEFLRRDEWQNSQTAAHQRIPSLSDVFDEIHFNPNSSNPERDKPNKEDTPEFGFGAEARKIKKFQTFGTSDKIEFSNHSFSDDDIQPDLESTEDYFNTKPVIVDCKAMILSDIQKEIDSTNQSPLSGNYNFYPKTESRTTAPFASPEQYSPNQNDLDRTLVQSPNPAFVTPTNNDITSNGDLSSEAIADFTPPTPVNTVSKLQHSESSGFKIVTKDSPHLGNKGALKDKSNIFIQTPPSYQSLVKSGKINLTPKNIKLTQPKLFCSPSDVDSENPVVTFV